ncbi:YIP1 family protein [Pseudodesulfovibrio senegalensis]|jgi:hypothetical protein|uniref:Yip1 domain-containing protein n=1 Tax=Pseudodesulfovibrio senegalensis TaxID=1721087 RepID=A0A6N6N554_9BACT|nr:YIP1 family protein [Pseudodesulfovibrio senegalensis]KAB1443186.1 hypothetical protein F8A88_02665 [Pseudodesulfovibrio senegalensis]
MSTATAQPAPETRTITVRQYIDTLVNIIRSPAAFYRSTADEANIRKPLMFLFVSGLFHATVSMSYFFENSLLMGGVFLLNAMFMPCLAAIFTFSLAGVLPGTKSDFSRIMSVYAYASGAVMVVSWIPALGMILEPVRAVLVIVGLNKACKMSWFKAFSMVVCSALLLLIFIWSLAPILAGLKDMLPA